MDAPLWAETHVSGLDGLPQPKVRDRLRRTVDGPMNLVMQGPPSVGKTATVRALAREAHADPENDLIELSVADFFNRTKKQIHADPRFEQFPDGRNRMTRHDTISRVLKESTNYAPMSGEYKTIVLDNAGSIRKDSQQAPRRAMKQHYRTTQFAIIVRQPSKLVPLIRSRCFPAPMPTFDDGAFEALLVGILDAKGANYDASDLRLPIDASDDNVRKTVLSAQRTAVEAGEVTMSTVHAALGDAGSDDKLKTLLINTREGDIKDARKTLMALLNDEGYEGQELLAGILHIADPAPECFADGKLVRLHELTGQVDPDISTGIDDRLHITHLLTSQGADIRGET